MELVSLTDDREMEPALPITPEQLVGQGVLGVGRGDAASICQQNESVQILHLMDGGAHKQVFRRASGDHPALWPVGEPLLQQQQMGR